MLLLLVEWKSLFYENIFKKLFKTKAAAARVKKRAGGMRDEEEFCIRNELKADKLKF
jgi:hypothetical protein